MLLQKSRSLRKKSPRLRNDFEKKGYSFLKKKKTDFKYESLKLLYTLESSYTPDFFSEKLKRVIEFKGHFRIEDKRKMLAVKKQYPELDFRIVFYSKSLKNIKWCEKHGFLWAIQDIPEDWLI